MAGGRGLGITARHVVKQLLAQAPIPDLWARVGDDEVRVPLAGFISDSGDFRASPITGSTSNPSEDVALFRLPDQDLYSPYTFSAAEHNGSAEYAVWGYPDEVRHDYFTEGQQLLNLPLIYSGGHIRRC